jgi:COMPASS component SWD3
MVNAISVHQDGTAVVTGDAAGCLKTWDIVAGKLVSSLPNEPSGRPITCISSCDSRITILNQLKKKLGYLL